MKERGVGWPQFHVVDVAVQGLVQSIHELCHATKPPPQVFQKNSLSRHCTEVSYTICASPRAEKVGAQVLRTCHPRMKRIASVGNFPGVDPKSTGRPEGTRSMSLFRWSPRIAQHPSLGEICPSYAM